MNTSTSRIHPSLKACKCGFIGTRAQLYKHFDHWKDICRELGESFVHKHGESLLLVDDPRLNVEKQLLGSITR